MGLTEFQDIFKGYCDVEKIEKKTIGSKLQLKMN